MPKKRFSAEQIVVHDVRDRPARLLLLSEVSILQPHDGIRGKGRSHLSRAVVSTPHEFPRSHPNPVVLAGRLLQRGGS